MIFGRDTIALKADDIEVEMNVVLNLDHSYPAEVTKHTIEKNGIQTKVTDHVVLGDRGISLNCILSSSSNLFALTSMSVDAKMKYLIDWQTKGQLITMLGYGTGGVIDKFLSLLPSFFQYLEPEDITERYVGRSRDEIPNLLLGDVKFTESTEYGDAVAGSIMLCPILIAEAKTRALANRNIPSKGKVQTKKENLPKPPAKGKTFVKSLFGG